MVKYPRCVSGNYEAFEIVKICHVVVRENNSIHNVMVKSLDETRCCQWPRDFTAGSCCYALLCSLRSAGARSACCERFADGVGDSLSGARAEPGFPATFARIFLMRRFTTERRRVELARCLYVENLALSSAFTIADSASYS